MKVIFLDIDGVMNRQVTAPRTRSAGFDAVPVACLKEILAATGAYIVVTGALGRSMCFEDLKSFFRHSGITGDKVIGVTSYLGGTRGEDITAWLDEHPYYREHYVVIDDAGPAEVEPHSSRLISTDWSVGLTPDHIPQTVRLLNG